MGCCGKTPRPGSPEVGKAFKPENNAGCGVGNGGCDSPTKAIEGTARHDWEEEHGKLITVLVTERVDVGLGVTASIQTYRREVCPKTNTSKRKGCCAIRYKVIR